MATNNLMNTTSIRRFTITAPADLQALTPHVARILPDAQPTRCVVRVDHYGVTSLGFETTRGRFAVYGHGTVLLPDGRTLAGEHEHRPIVENLLDTVLHRHLQAINTIAMC